MTERTVLVVSPLGGIGKSITISLIQKGWFVIGMGGSYSKNEVQKFSKRENFEFFEIDYFDHQNLVNKFSELKESYEKIDGFVHLAGGSLISKEIGKIHSDEFLKVIDLNLTSTFIIGQEVFRWMKNTEGGNLVFFGSTTGIVPSAKKLPYAVAKAGVHMLSRAFALEGAPFGIISNAIAPSYVMTERHIEELKRKAEQRGVPYEQAVSEVRSKNPIKGLLWPEDLNQVVELLLTTKTITGETISADLGQTTVL